MQVVADKTIKKKTLPAFFQFFIKWWTYFITIGVTDSLDDWTKKRTRLINGICVISVGINLIFISSYLSPEYRVTFYECLQIITANLIVILINYFHGYNAACHFFLVYNLFSYSFQAVSHGPIDGVEYVLVSNGICSMMFFKNIRTVLIYFVLNGIFFGVCKYLFTIVTPFLVMANGESFYVPNHVLLFLLPLLIIYFFRNENKRQEELLQTENTKLTAALSELKKTQQQLIQQEKLASLGQLTAGIAHEIKNPLNFVNNFSDLNEEMLEEMLNAESAEEKNSIANELKENFRRIGEHGKRADRIVQSMMMHARTGESEKQQTDINELCNESASLAFHGARASDSTFVCDFKIDLQTGLPVVNMVRQDVGRVILNILSNAFYAVHAKTKKSLSDYKPKVTLTTSIANQSLLISITDNGTGIPPDILKSIFEPFFTTKPTGIGTGLGLSISYDIIQSHGGRIDVQSSSNEGTRFNITLPLNGATS